MPEPLPESIYQGTISIMGVELKVHGLSDGKRIIESDSLADFLDAMANGPRLTEEEAVRLARFVKGLDGHA